MEGAAVEVRAKMYTRIRQRMLERQCIELLHEVAEQPDCPHGLAEQAFAIELYTLVHNTLRTFRDARCKLGRIVNDDDLYYLTKKLSQAVILKEIHKFRQTQMATASSLFSKSLHPELSQSVQSRVTLYVKKYMESKGAFYRRRVQNPSLVRPDRTDQMPCTKTETEHRIQSHGISKTLTNPQDSRPNISLHTMKPTNTLIRR